MCIRDRPIADAQGSVERWLRATEADECVRRICGLLTEKEKAVFTDYFLKGMRAEEIAYKHATTTGGVKSILRKIRVKSRREKLECFLLLLGILSRFY